MTVFLVKKLIDNFRNHYGLAGGTEDSFKKFFFTGQCGENNRNEVDVIFLTLSLYGIWHGKIRNTLPSLPTLINNIEYSFDVILRTNKRLTKIAKTNNNVCCRQWRERGAGGE